MRLLLALENLSPPSRGDLLVNFLGSVRVCEGGDCSGSMGAPQCALPCRWSGGSGAFPCWRRASRPMPFAARCPEFAAAAEQLACGGHLLVSGRNSLGGDWCDQFWFCCGFAMILVYSRMCLQATCSCGQIRDTPAHPARCELGLTRKLALHPARIELATFSVLG